MGRQLSAQEENPPDASVSAVLRAQVVLQLHQQLLLPIVMVMMHMMMIIIASLIRLDK
jgi:hypothetical protein